MLKLTIRQGIQLSAIVDKLGIAIKDPNASNAQVGADLVMQALSKAHRAEQEIYAFVADVKGIPVEQAASEDLFGFLQALTGREVTSFFASAVRSGPQS